VKNLDFDTLCMHMRMRQRVYRYLHSTTRESPDRYSTNFGSVRPLKIDVPFLSINFEIGFFAV
jgi:hypothetical protein